MVVVVVVVVMVVVVIHMYRSIALSHLRSPSSVEFVVIVCVTNAVNALPADTAFLGTNIGTNAEYTIQ